MRAEVALSLQLAFCKLLAQMPQVTAVDIFILDVLIIIIKVYNV
jgi:hypothetical protein